MNDRDGFTPLDPEAQLGYLLVRVADQVARPWSAALRSRGINPKQFSALAWLARAPGLSAGELARRVMMTPQSMSESLTKLLDAGLVARAEVERGHAARLQLTPRGKALLSKAYPHVESANRESFASLTSAERQELARILLKMMGRDERR